MSEPHDDAVHISGRAHVPLLQTRLDRVLTSRHGICMGPLMALGVLVRERPGSPGPADQRATRIAVTEAGVELWTRAAHTLDGELDLAFEKLGSEEKYTNVVARLCRTGDAPPAP